MTFKFFFFFDQFHLFFLIFKKKRQIKKKTRLVETEAIEIFEYKKNNDRY